MSRVKVLQVGAFGLGGLLLTVSLVVASVAWAAPSSDATKGKAAFDKNCAGCHGEAGKGGLGPPLAKDVSYFVNAGVPNQLVGPLLTQSVRQRPPGSKMTPFTPAQLSDADVQDIGDYLVSLTPAPASPPKLGTAANGAKPFADNCSACHGAKGEGGKGPAVAMMAAQFKQMKAPENLMLAFVTLATRSGSLPNMPSFAPDKLSDAQLADIAAYIWSIAPSELPVLPKTGDGFSLLSLIIGGLGLLSLVAGAALRLRSRTV